MQFHCNVTLKAYSGTIQSDIMTQKNRLGQSEVLVQTSHSTSHSTSLKLLEQDVLHCIVTLEVFSIWTHRVNSKLLT